MNLDRVTITGADDQTNINDLLALSKEFPFVEWGILVHAMGSGPRFPDLKWIEDLTSREVEINLSLHLCGRWVRRLLQGVIEMNPEFLRSFPRVQLNFHAEQTACEPEQFFQALCALDESSQHAWIFQLDGAGGNKHLEAVYSENGRNAKFVPVGPAGHQTRVNTGAHVWAYPLFDTSGGAGLVPASWPEVRYTDGTIAGDDQLVYHGYAGGLGPDTLARELPRIAEAAGDNRIWIDMEARVRTDDVLDLQKVRKVLEFCAPLVKYEKGIF